MSLISSRVNLRHLCTIERDTASAGAWGVPDTAGWQTHLSDVPCRAWTPRGREIVQNDTVVVTDEQRIIVPLGTDVTEQDRVATVTYRGDAVITGPAGIRAVIRRQDHIELVLERAA